PPSPARPLPGGNAAGGQTRSIAETVELLEEAFPSERDRSQRAVETAGDLRVRLPLGCEQDDLRPQHLAMRHGVAGSPRPQLQPPPPVPLDPEGPPRLGVHPFRRRARLSFNTIARVLTAGST